MRHAYAGVFLVVDETVIGLLRDDVAGIDNPGRIGPFGGTVEPGEEPLAAAWRELVEEETNLRLAPEDLEPFTSDVAWRALTEEWEDRHVFVARVSPAALAALEIYEGRQWATIASADDRLLIDSYRDVLARLLRDVHADGNSSGLQ